jgi:predicted homoserine dehydrogenase-like protein
MVNVDAALAGLHRDRKPIQVGMVGAGTTGHMIAVQLLTPVPGIRLAAIANRTIDRAVSAYRNAGVEDVSLADNAGQVQRCIERGAYCVVDDPALLCAAGGIDVIIEVTGAVEHGASVALEAIRQRKHVILVNAEVDSTVGPILAAYAREAGVVMTNTDGDEPGVAMTLIRYLKSIGLRPVAAGNMKGMIDHYRTPETQRAFAEKYGQSAPKVTSFADGTKLSMECAVLANASGFGMSPTWSTSCRWTGFSRAASSIMRSAQRRTPAPSCSFTRTIRRSRRNWLTSSWAMGRSTHSMCRTICRTSRSHRPSRTRRSIMMVR